MALETLAGLETIAPGFIALLVIIAIFDGVLKIISMWKCGRRNQLAWFIVLAIFNTAGILPIVYLLIYKGKKPAKW